MDRETVARHVKAASLDDPDDPSGTDPPGSNATIVIAGSGDEPQANAANVITGSADGQAAAVASNAAIPITGSAGRQSRCQPWREIIVQGLEQGLTARRIWQDLTADHGFVGDYQSVQRFVRRLKNRSPLPYRRMECEAGAERKWTLAGGRPSSAPTAAHAAALVPRGAELLAQSVQRGCAAADRRGIYPLSGECVRVLRRRAVHPGGRQSQGRRHQGRLVRSGAEPQDPGLRRALRHGGVADAPVHAAAQGQGRAWRGLRAGQTRCGAEPLPAWRSRIDS